MKSRGDRGASKLTLLVFGVVAAVILYCGFRIVPFYYYFYEIQNQMDQVVRVATTYSDSEIRSKLMSHIKKLELPVDEKDLKISRTREQIFISLEYSEVFYITFRGKDYDLHTFDFFAHSEGKIA